MIINYIFRRKPVTVVTASKYGYLYNGYAVVDTRHLSANGWDFPTESQWNSLITYVGSNPGTKLKASGTTYWAHNNGTDNYGLSLLGNGKRSHSDGSFSDLKDQGYYWISGNRCLQVSDTTSAMSISNANKASGFSVRFCRLATGVSDGVNGVYTGNDGQTYVTVVINHVEWMTEDLRETKFRNGADIINYQQAAEWITCSEIPSIRTTYGEGIVFATDHNYLYVVTPEPAVIGNNYGNYGDYIHATADGYLGAGKENTFEMLDEEPDTFFTELATFGYAGIYDWYVPCVYELQKIIDEVYDLLTIPNLGSYYMSNRINTSTEYDYDLYYVYTEVSGFDGQYYKGDIDPATDGFTFGVRQIPLPNSSARCAYNNDPGNVIGIDNLVTYNGVPVVYNGNYVIY